MFFLFIKLGDIIEHFRSFEVHMSDNLKQEDVEKLQANLKLLGAKTSNSTE